MKDVTIFENSGLQDIQFVNFGKDLLVTFHSCYNGEDIGSILCHDIVLFKFSDPHREYIDTGLSEIDKGFFACFIGDVIIEKVSDYYSIKLEPMENMM